MKYFILFFMVKLVCSFCIYNDVITEEGVKTTFWIRQHPLNAGPIYFSRFGKSSLGPGEKACCAYNNGDCVRPKTKDTEIKMVIRRKTGNLDYPPTVVSMPAGGWMVLGGGASPPTRTIDVFTADGEPYDYSYVVDFQAGYQ